MPGQVTRAVRAGEVWQCRVMFMADVPAHGEAAYLVFHGNPLAELPEYVTDLRVEGEGHDLTISNHHYRAKLSRQMGQLERLTYRREHGLELYAGGKGHGEPPGIDWAHDYVDQGQFQKLRINSSPTLHYPGHGQLWSRYPLHHAELKAGTSIRQRNAYLVFDDAAGLAGPVVEGLRQRLLHPVDIRPGEVPKPAKAAREGSLARPGETAESAPLKPAIWRALAEVTDDQLYTLKSGIVDLGYVYDVRVRQGVVHVSVTMPHRGRPVHDFLVTRGGGRVSEGIRERVLRLDGVRDVVVDLTWNPPWTEARLSEAGRRELGLGTRAPVGQVSNLPGFAIHEPEAQAKDDHIKSSFAYASGSWAHLSSESEGVVVDGLDQVVVEARLPRAAAVLVLAVARDGDDDRVPAALVPPEPATRPRSRPSRAGRCPGGRTPAGTPSPPRWPRGRRRPSPPRARGASGAAPARGPCPRCRRRPGSVTASPPGRRRVVRLGLRRGGPPRPAGAGR